MISISICIAVWLASFAFGCALVYCWMLPKVEQERRSSNFWKGWAFWGFRLSEKAGRELTTAQKQIVALRRQVPGRDLTGRFTKKPKASQVDGSE